jgi:hypothetical protein
VSNVGTGGGGDDASARDEPRLSLLAILQSPFQPFFFVVTTGSGSGSGMTLTLTAEVEAAFEESLLDNQLLALLNSLASN